MMGIWPAFKDTEKPLCFACGGLLREPGSLSGFPPGSGARSGYCSRCHMATFYDVIPTKEQDHVR